MNIDRRSLVEGHLGRALDAVDICHVTTERSSLECYASLQTHTGCLNDWTTLHQAMLEHFGFSIRARKARAALLQLMQNKMTVLQYANAFAFYLAQLEDYDE